MSSFRELFREPLARDYAKCHLCRNERRLPVLYTYFVCDHHTYLQEKTINAKKSREIGTRSVAPMQGRPADDGQTVRFNMSN